MAGIKIVDLPALGRDLISTDLLELSLAGGTGSRKITGQEIMNASKLSVGNTPIINGAVGQVLFQGTGNVLQESANLFWDNANGRLGIGTSTPTRTLSVVGSGTSGFDAISFKGQYSKVGYLATDNAGAYLASGAGVTESYIGLTATSLTLQAASALIDFRVGASRGVIFSTGNWFIGSSATDAGFRLDVNGTARFTGQFSSGASSNFQICQNSGNVNFQVRADGYVQFNNYTPLSGGTMNVLDGSRISMFGGGPLSGNINQFSMSHLFQTNVSSHTYTGVLISTTINQTGGANGITRGLYIAPTLTSAFDFRAIETTVGNVLLGTTSGNVGIGTSSPVVKYHQSQTQGILAQYDVTNANANQNRGVWEFYTNTAVTPDFFGRFGFKFEGGINNASRQFQLHVADNTNPRFVVNGNGNVLIGTTTDAGFRLDVNGTARVSGVLTPENNINLYSAGTAIKTIGAYWGGNTVYGLNIQGNASSITGTGGIPNGYIVRIGSAFSLSPTDSVDIDNVRIATGNFNPTSGNARLNLLSIFTTINQTGTANGAVRGFYYNPTVTSVLGSHWAIHTTAGRVRFEGLPTSPTGLNAGDIYNDGGTLRIV